MIPKRHLNIQPNLRKNNDTAKKVYATEKAIKKL
jgi:hypothetical protein